MANFPGPNMLEVVRSTIFDFKGVFMHVFSRRVSRHSAVRPGAARAAQYLVLSAAVVLFGGCKQANRDAADIGPSSTARANTSGGGSTSDGRVSGATPLGQDLPQRETATRTGPGTPNPAHGGSTIAGASGKDASGNLAGTGTGGPANTGTRESASARGDMSGDTGGGTTGAGGGGTDATTGTGTDAGMIGSSGSPAPATAPGTPHVSASGATSTGGSGIPNAPGMAAGPNGRRSASEGATTLQR